MEDKVILMELDKELRGSAIPYKELRVLQIPYKELRVLQSLTTKTNTERSSLSKSIRGSLLDKTVLLIHLIKVLSLEVKCEELWSFGPKVSQTKEGLKDNMFC